MAPISRKYRKTAGGKMSHGRMARRRVLALGAGGIAGLGLGPQTLIGGRKAMAQGTPETVVYVSNAGSKEVFVLAMNRGDGRARADREDPGSRHRQAVAGQPADGNQPG